MARYATEYAVPSSIFKLTLAVFGSIRALFRIFATSFNTVFCFFIIPLSRYSSINSSYFILFSDQVYFWILHYVIDKSFVLLQFFTKFNRAIYRVTNLSFKHLFQLV